MQESSLTFPTLGSPPRFTFPELITHEYSSFTHNDHSESCCSELSSSTSTPFVSAPSSPSSARMKGFYFSAPTSPTWSNIIPYWRPHQQQELLDLDSSCQSINSWSHKRLHVNFQGSLQEAQLYSDSAATGTPAPKPDPRAAAAKLLHAADQIPHWPASPTPPLHSQRHAGSTSPWPHSPSAQTEREGRSNPPRTPRQTHHSSSSSWSPESFPPKLESEGPNWAPPSAQTEEHHSTSSWYHKAPQAKHSCSSHQYQVCPQMGESRVVSNDAASRTALKRLQAVEDLDQSYSRSSLYASAVPFAWEEKPGTPKARSVTSEASNGEDDAASVLLSGSSDFEFSARFADLEEPPMSPTPISSSGHSFKYHVAAYENPYAAYKNDHMQSVATTKLQEEQIWPLRPPPRLDNRVLPMKQLIKDDGNEHTRSYGSLSSLSAPQSPRSPRKFDIRGVLCGISRPGDVVFDPFLVAMEKSMQKDRGNFTSSEMQMAVKNEASRDAPHHRRTQSSSPLRIFHWDDHSAKSNSSSNGSSTMDDIKSKHPIQREIDARHNAGTPKGSKRWSFRGFLHRKSDSGGESARHSNTSSSLRSSGRESNMSSTSRRESCSSSATGEVLIMDVSNSGDDMNNIKTKSPTSPTSNSSSTMLSSMPSTAPPSILSPSASNNSSKGKHNAHHRATHKGPYALHYDMQRAHTEDLRKKTFLPYKQGLLGCLGFPSKSYRAITTISKPLQSVS